MQVSFILSSHSYPGFPGGSDSEESACRPGFNPWIGKIPWSRKGQPAPAVLPGKFHGQRRLVGYSPWDWETRTRLSHWAQGLLCEWVKLFSRARLLATPRTVAYQAPQSMEFSRQEYCSGLPFPPPGSLNPGLPHCRQTLYCLSHQGSPKLSV